MRWLVFLGMVATAACTRANPAYGDGGGSGGGTADDDASSVSDEASASADDDDDSASVSASADDDDDGSVDTRGEDTGTDARECCATHASPGCDDSSIQECVCSEAPACCELEWRSECVKKAHELCGAPCGTVDTGVVDDGTDAGSTSIPPATSDDSATLTDSVTDSAGSTSTTDGGGSTGGGAVDDCCIAHDSPGCNDDVATSCVCNLMPVCCKDGWSDGCVEQAFACKAVCAL